MAQPATHNSSRKIRVLIIDDSAVVRGLTRRWIDAEADFTVVDAAVDGEQGIAFAKKHQPDVIILDVEMPRLDGVSAIPLLKSAAPQAMIIMASTLTARGADVTLKALSAGAADYIPKPSNQSIANARTYTQDLVDKVRALGKAAQSRSATGLNRPGTAPAPQTVADARKAASLPARPALPLPAKDAKIMAAPPRALVIASSTGGPQALKSVFSTLGVLPVPVFVVQHMPGTFTRMLAEHITRDAAMPCSEAQDGQPVRAGHIYLAPGGFHMTVKSKAGGAILSLDQKPPVNFCRPAADPLFQTASEVYEKSLLGVVLTGMGQDGMDGAGFVRRAGGGVIAQDEATSVVWGMPGAVTRAGHASAVLPLQDISQKIQMLFRGGR